MRTLRATRSGVCIIQQGRHLPMVLKQPTTQPFTALTTAESKSKKELQQPTKQPCMALMTAENASKSESHSAPTQEKTEPMSRMAAVQGDEEGE